VSAGSWDRCSYGSGGDGHVGRTEDATPWARTTGGSIGGGGQCAYLSGPGEAGDTGWLRRLVLCGGSAKHG
jgi:hypothetical protein